MRTITYEKIVATVEQLCIESCYKLPDDVLAALKNAAESESNPRAKKILTQLIENARIAKDERIPLCQDTGLAVVFVQTGSGVIIEPPADRPVGHSIYHDAQKHGGDDKSRNYQFVGRATPLVFSGHHNCQNN